MWHCGKTRLSAGDESLAFLYPQVEREGTSGVCYLITMVFHRLLLQPLYTVTVKKRLSNDLSSPNTHSQEAGKPLDSVTGGDLWQLLLTVWQGPKSNFVCTDPPGAQK